MSVAGDAVPLTINLLLDIHYEATAALATIQASETVVAQIATRPQQVAADNSRGIWQRDSII